MAAISFDQPSNGKVTSISKALTIVNKGTGGALSCIADNTTGHAIWGESLGNDTGVYGKSAKGHAIWGECMGSMNGVVGRSATGNGVWGHGLTGGAGVVGKSVTGNGVHAESEGGGNGLYATSKTGHGIWGESLGENMGVYGKSAKGHAIWGECMGSMNGVVGRSATGNGVWGHGLTGGAGVVGKSVTGNGVHAESEGGGNGLYATSKTGRAGYFKGDVEVTGDILLVNADCAEEFDINSQQVEPGTVMVLDNNGSLEPSCKPYDKKVAGIISGAGRYKPGIVLDKQQYGEKRQETNNPSKKIRMAVALMGKVYCKVDATLSSIEIGDLLTTSSTVGHAMKAEDPFNAFGSVIGKALQPLKEGKGMIPVLVALQ